MSQWVAVGVMTSGRRKVPAEVLLNDHAVKTFGPFDTPDEARQFVNDLALEVPIAWNVQRLRQPA